MNRSAVMGVFLVLAMAPSSIAQERTEPVDPGFQEELRVRMTVLDVIVLDKEGRTVPGLTTADFEIIVHGDKISVASLDVDCPGGGAVDPKGAYRASGKKIRPAPTGGRKIVLAVDYLHLTPLERVTVLDEAKAMVEDGATAEDEIMVVALTGGLRVEQPFSSDRKRTLATLHRMKYDITLWNGNFSHIDERGFVDGMTSTFDVLGEVPGAKAAVLFSAMRDTPLDLQVRKISALAAGSRCSIYPVDVRGLMPADVGTSQRAVEHSTEPGTPAHTNYAPPLFSLARLAVETGGRLTEATNDLGLGFARAQRDQACIYSIGFYDPDPREDQARTVTISVRRAGLRVVHPTAYVLRSTKERKQSLLRAAFFSPESFQTGVVRAHVFPIRPTTKKSWEGLLAVSFPISLAGSGGQAVEREFGGVLSDKTGPVHQFNRSIRLEPKSETVTAEPLVTFLEPVTLRPGTYALATVLTDPASVAPHAVKVECDVPPIPTREAFLVGPILARRAGKNLVVRSRGRTDTVGEWNSFDPLLVQSVEDPTDLVAMTLVCIAHGKKADAGRSVMRRFRSIDGRVIGNLDPVRVALEGSDGIRCGTLVDVLPSRATSRGGRVSLRGRSSAVRATRSRMGRGPLLGRAGEAHGQVWPNATMNQWKSVRSMHGT